MKNIHQLQKELTFGTGELWTIKDDGSLRCFYKSKGLIFNISGSKITTTDASYTTIIAKDAKKMGYTLEATSDGVTSHGKKTYRYTCDTAKEFTLVEYVKSLENHPTVPSRIDDYQVKAKSNMAMQKEHVNPILPGLKHINAGYYGLRFGMDKIDSGSRVFSLFASHRNTFSLSAVIKDPSAAMTEKITSSLVAHYHDSALADYSIADYSIADYSITARKNEISLSVSVENADDNRMAEFMRLFKESGLQAIYCLIHNDLIMGVR